MFFLALVDAGVPTEEASGGRERQASPPVLYYARTERIRSSVDYTPCQHTMKRRTALDYK